MKNNTFVLELISDYISYIAGIGNVIFIIIFLYGVIKGINKKILTIVFIIILFLSFFVSIIDNFNRKNIIKIYKSDLKEHCIVYINNKLIDNNKAYNLIKILKEPKDYIDGKPYKSHKYIGYNIKLICADKKIYLKIYETERKKGIYNIFTDSYTRKKIELGKIKTNFFSRSHILWERIPKPK